MGMAADAVWRVPGGCSAGSRYQALTNCEKVLGCDATNVKALFRKAQALMARREYTAARTVLREVYKLDPTNKQVISLLKKADAQARKDRKEEKKRMAKMMGEMIEDEESRQARLAAQAARDEAATAR
jgi:tetratricopeptide (TPR) repeat protein